MDGFLAELGKKLAERWLSLLVLPGALHLAVGAAAHALGHRHAFEPGRLGDRIGAWADSVAALGTGGRVVLLAAVLCGAAVVGLAAQGLGSLVERGALAVGWRSWPRPLRDVADRLTDRRAARWNTADAAFRREAERHRAAARSRNGGARPDPAARDRAYRTRNAVAAERPDRPTWSGDRLNATAVRMNTHFRIDMAAVWPPLWLQLPEAVRAEITSARQDLTRATVLGAWAVLYAPVGVLWWPAVVVAAILALAARHRIRGSATTLAVLHEAALRTYAVGLARHLGIDHEGPLSPELGDLLTARLHTPATRG